jgi:3-phenylpropionate/trans-cinnamate dioxygenase ferredoxin reductase component
VSETIITVGAGHGGAHIVESLRTGGFAGRLILIGDERHLPYERPATSKEFLAGAIEFDRVFLKHGRFYDEKNIELMLDTRVTAIDRKAKMLSFADGAKLAYDKLILATGAKVAIECFTGEGTVNGVRLTDGSEIPADLVVVGIGAAPNTELAAAAGLAVDNGIVVDAQARISSAAAS